ncbi:MAG TPA: OmpW family outer membrane protein [Steroidobacteraceae bacterium]|nr:OmpW family outer membrane protein [Steroidobacteraceae bacterium]
MRVTRAVATLGALLGLACSIARAGDDPVYSNDVRLGMYYVFYDVSASDIAGPGIPPGENLNVNLNNLVTLYAAYVRRLSPHFSFELTAGYPPLTKTVGRGPATVGSVPYNGVVISTARWFAPTGLLEYNFFDEDRRFRPYLGVGVNYTRFFARQSTAAGDEISGGPTQISLPASVGIAGTVGLSYRIANRFHVYASYSASTIRSKLTADTAGVLRTSSISFGPQAVVVSLGWAF